MRSRGCVKLYVVFFLQLKPNGHYQRYRSEDNLSVPFVSEQLLKHTWKMRGNNDFICFYSLFYQGNCWNNPIHIAYGASYPCFRPLFIRTVVETYWVVAEIHRLLDFLILLAVAAMAKVPPTFRIFTLTVSPSLYQVTMAITNWDWKILKAISPPLGHLHGPPGCV